MASRSVSSLTLNLITGAYNYARRHRYHFRHIDDFITITATLAFILR
jgi:hypothetical protein